MKRHLQRVGEGRIFVDSGYALIPGMIRLLDGHVPLIPYTDSSERFGRGAFLIDTGASRSGVNSSFAKRLSFPQVGSQVITGASGPSKMPLYPVTLIFQQSNFAIDYEHIMGVEIDTAQTGSPLPLIGVLGSDFLNKCVFVRDGLSGRFTLDFDRHAIR